MVQQQSALLLELRNKKVELISGVMEQVECFASKFQDQLPISLLFKLSRLVTHGLLENVQIMVTL